MTLIDTMNLLTEVAWIEMTKNIPPIAMGRWRAESVVVLVAMCGGVAGHR